MNYDLAFHDSLQSLPQVCEMIRNTMDQLHVDTKPLPGRLVVEWSRSSLKSDELKATLSLPDSEIRPTLRVSRDQLSDPIHLPELQRTLNRKLDDLHFWYSRRLIRELELLSNGPVGVAS